MKRRYVFPASKNAGFGGRTSMMSHERGILSDATPTRGRQVLVGDFAPEDCDDYLACRLHTDRSLPRTPNQSEPSRTQPRVPGGRAKLGCR
ncbi:hypothetical protein R1T08_04940 [Streptomyces sp. SBC-4]|nr:hypothetical protein [Streptomyces sp. SBC-4]MDV5143646.1 hypothetical protein [Streptomyces sp. SBC-4]